MDSTPFSKKNTSIFGALTFCTDANKLGAIGYTAQNNKVFQSLYASVEESELYAFLMILLDFNGSIS